jgi:hypothetical protein
MRWYTTSNTHFIFLLPNMFLKVLLLTFWPLYDFAYLQVFAHRIVTIALSDFDYTRYPFSYNLTSTTSQGYIWYSKNQQNSLFTNFPSTPRTPKSLPATSSLQNHKISTFTSTLSIPHHLQHGPCNDLNVFENIVITTDDLRKATPVFPHFHSFILNSQVYHDLLL